MRSYPKLDNALLIKILPYVYQLNEFECGNIFSIQLKLGSASINHYWRD